MNSLKASRSYSHHVKVEEVTKFPNFTTRDFVIHSPIETHFPEFFQSIKQTVGTLVDSSRQRDIVKVSLGIRVIFKNTQEEDVSIYYNPKFFPLLANNQFDEFYDNTKESFFQWLDGFQERGSGLTFQAIDRAYFKIVKTKPITGGTYIPLPFAKRSIINIQNYDNKCFLWCIIAHFILRPEIRHE